LTDDSGMAVMELRCPNRHLVGRIIKYSVGSPLLLDMPKRLREDWKQVSERPMLTTHCWGVQAGGQQGNRHDQRAS
jgi:hypothetical protein